MKLRCFFAGLIALAASLQVSAGQYFTKHMIGTAGPDSASLFLSGLDTVVTGYYSINQRPEIFYYLNGKVDEAGNIMLTVSDSGNVVLASCIGTIRNGKLDVSNYPLSNPDLSLHFSERNPPAGWINFSYGMHREKKSCAKMPDSCYVYRCQYFLPDGGMNDAAKANLTEDLAIVAFGVSAKPRNGKPPLSYSELIQADASAYFDAAMKSPKPQKKEKYVLVRNCSFNILTMLCVQRNINPASGWTMETHFRNYDITTGDTIPLKKLFKKGFEKALSDSLRMEVCRLYDISPSDQLTVAGFKSNTIPLSPNYFITDNSIGFYFNTGEISTDNVPAQITLRPSAIKNLIDPKGPIGWMLKP